MPPVEEEGPGLQGGGLWAGRGAPPPGPPGSRASCQAGRPLREEVGICGLSHHSAIGTKNTNEAFYFIETQEGEAVHVHAGF